VTDTGGDWQPMTPGAMRALPASQVLAAGWRPADMFDHHGLEILAGAAISAWVLLDAGQRYDVATRASDRLDQADLDEDTAVLTRWEIDILSDADLARKIRALLPAGVVAAEEGRTDVLLRPFPLAILEGERRVCNSCGTTIAGAGIGVLDRLEPPDGPGDVIDDLIWCAECVMAVASQLIAERRALPGGTNEFG
jgi:hypothetical protein